ncbi:MAG TPA: hypothetical protein VGN47_06355 [Blastococcus sp.]|jgi:hypothetical protein|nr:hypothetical protein [Blastococcus sp.]
MSDPTGPEQNYPQGGAPQEQPGWGAPQQPAPGYGPAPTYSGAPAGYGAPTAQRPGLVTAAAVIGVVWGALGTLFGLLAIAFAFGVNVLLGLVVLIALVLSIALLVGGIFVLTGKPPKLLLYAAYVAIAINVIELIISIVQNGGNAFSGVLGFVLPGIVVGLLRQPASRQYFASRGQSY